LGAFDTNGVERLPHGFVFFCDYGHPLDANGLGYSVEPLRENVNEHAIFRLSRVTGTLFGGTDPRSSSGGIKWRT
jgi:hypothetical protein